ncbi:PREDICTED: nucleoprotein TPR-like isoform X1 [Acropora digitifera]|uniref:nucleoprotein TPR-like isoform X1 n=1 Tax=Acropora digitifera TaxID=70779 RepID=UPI00077AD9C1|nr:PREDICTED: nucleoprotein TPR-like isoform X1 [Acropora digitifera]
MKSLTAAASKSASGSSLRASPSELSGAETSVTQEVPSSISVTSAPPVSLVPPTATIKPTTTPTPIKRAGPKASVRPIAVAPTQSTPTPTATVLPTVTSTPSEAASVAGVVRATTGTFTTPASSVSTSVPTTVSVRPITSTEEERRQSPEGEPEVSSTEASTSEQSQPSLSTAVVSGKRQRDELKVTDGSTSEIADGTVTEEEPVSKRIRMVELQVEGEVGTSQEAVEEEALAEEEAFDDQYEAIEAEEGTEFSDVEEEDEDAEGDDEEQGEEDEEEEEEEEEEDEEDEDDEDEGAAAGTADVPVEAEPDAPEVVLIESDEEEEDCNEVEVEEYVEEDEEGEMDEEDGEDEEEYMKGEGEEDEGEQIEEDEVGKENAEDMIDQQSIVEVIDDEDVQEGEDTTEAMEDDPLVEGPRANFGEAESAPEMRDDSRAELQPGSTDTPVETEIPTTAQQLRVQEREVQVLGSDSRGTSPLTTQPLPRRLSIRSHLAPFSFPQGQPAPGPFNDEEDCMVPSTPTLFVPKRTDGFAEAISSPQINPASFSFGAPGESSMSSAGALQLGLSEEGLRVDDTQVDLMGGTDEASNERPSFVVPTGLPESSEASSQSNQRLPSTGSETRQLSLESLESEPEGGNIATVPAITVTQVTEESNEQNVPVSQAHPESLETEAGELLDEAEALKDDTGDHEAAVKERFVLGQHPTIANWRSQRGRMVRVLDLKSSTP